MKKIFTVIFLLPLLSFGQVSDLSSLPNLFNGTKICLDPGHGGHDGDDREINLGYGLTYWESDGVFAQANYTAEILEALGADVKVTRYTNDSHDEFRQPSLSERVAIGNAFEADFFHSIHTNAGSGTVNYTSVYQYENADTFLEEQSNMCSIMNEEIQGSIFTKDETYNKKANFGVLRGNDQPAVLSEASMHDFTKEGRRLNTSAYQKALAYSYVRSFLRYFEFGEFPYGEISGRIFYNYDSSTNNPIYGPNGYDHGQEVEFAKITLEKDGLAIATQYTDKGHNGYFLFDMLQGGNYTVKVEKEGLTTQVHDVTVVTNSNIKINVDFGEDQVVEEDNRPVFVYTGLSGNDGVKAVWLKSKITGLKGYRLYWSNDKNTWKLVADETILDAASTDVTVSAFSEFKEPASGKAQYYKLVAIGDENSADSKIFVVDNLGGSNKVLLVNAYQSLYGDEEVDNSLSSKYYESLITIDDIGEIETISSFELSQTGVSLDDYDYIIWALANERTENYSFSLEEKTALKRYLEQGGHLVLSGADIGYDLILNGTRSADQDFYTDFLKAKCSTDDSYSDGVVKGVVGTFMEGVSSTFLVDRMKMTPDNISTWAGSESIAVDENGNTIGVGFRGEFSASGILGGLVYFSFPLETVPQNDLDQTLTKTFEYLADAVPGPPEAVKLLAATKNKYNDGVVLHFEKSTSNFLAGYNVYYQESGSEEWKLAADYTTINTEDEFVNVYFSNFINKIETPVAVSYKIHAVALANGNVVEGEASNAMHHYFSDGIVNVLVVDGYDRHVRMDDFYKMHVDAFSKIQGVNTVSTCPNEIVERGLVDLKQYTDVYWVLGEESTIDETFSDTEQNLVKKYLEGGGHLFVSGAEIGWDLSNEGSETDRAFYNNYLKATFASDGSSSSVSVNGVSGSLFEGVAFEFSKLWKVEYPDQIASFGGSEVIFNYNDGGVSGVAYKGVFGSSTVEGGVMYLGFPIETALQNDIEVIAKLYLEYFHALVEQNAPVANDDVTRVVTGSYVEADVLANDTDDDNDIDGLSLEIIDMPANGFAEISIGAKISYVSNTDFTGEDVITYKVFDRYENESNIATLTITVENGLGMPYETEVDPLHPKRDMRAVFLTTVKNIDWPFSVGGTVEKQQSDFVELMNRFESANVNTIMFQIRPAADAFYKSKYEPWSYFLTGVQGQDPGYDPLQFAIDDAHSRGMELHAWMNPYRTISGTYPLSADHVENEHPEWVMEYTSGESAGKRILNPGIPEVMEYIVSVVEDLIVNYDVDGVHFDDYFYLYGGTPNELDQEAFDTYNPGGLSRADWRRNNVNTFVRMVYEKIQEVNQAQNKNVAFGISPFGIWKSGVPPGTSGTSGYDALYADAVNWLENGVVDYIAPQLYWNIGSPGQDYIKLVEWWNEQAAINNRYNLSSNALYKMSGSDNWPAEEILDQVAKNRGDGMDNTLGQIFFPSKTLAVDVKKVKTKLLNDLYKYPSVSASYIWKEQIAPNSPMNLSYSGAELTWDAPSAAVDSDTARRYVVYRYSTMEELITDRHNGRKIVAVTGKNSVVVPDNWLAYGENYFVVSSIDKNNNESEFSNVEVVDNRPAYCDAKGLDSSSEWIERIKVQNDNNISGNNNGYKNFSDVVFSLSIGDETPVVLVPGFSAASIYQHWKVFIDFNNDGDFSGTEETVFETSLPTRYAVQENVAIPLDVIEGVYKMRVVMKGSSGDNDINPCEDFEFGEVEDYLVNLTHKELSVDDISSDEITGVVFPNPFMNSINFKMLSQTKGDVEFVVYNYMGQIVYHRTMVKTAGENNFTINSSSWTEGVYLLLVRDENGKKKVYELVKS